MQLINSFLEKFEDQWIQIIRPYRLKYSQFQMGPKIQVVDQQTAILRKDFTVKNSSDQLLQCSIYECQEDLSPSKLNESKIPCVVYLHANSGSRIEAQFLVTKICPQGFAMVCFDFSGAGNSEGEYVSLGAKEINDFESVFNYLESLNRFEQYVLWGRSMGAFTGLKYILEHHDSKIMCLVLDSPYFSLKNVMIDLVQDKVPLPYFLIETFINILSSKLQEKIQVDLLKQDLTEKLEFANIQLPPILIGYGNKDNIVKQYQVLNHYLILHFVHEMLYKKQIFIQIDKIMELYKGNKKLIMFEGDHSTSRPQEFINDSINFIVHYSMIVEQNGSFPNKPVIMEVDKNNSKFDRYRQQKQQPLKSSQSFKDLKAKSIVNSGNSSEKNSPNLYEISDYTNRDLKPYECVTDRSHRVSQNKQLNFENFQKSLSPIVKEMKLMKIKDLENKIEVFDEYNITEETHISINKNNQFTNMDGYFMPIKEIKPIFQQKVQNKSKGIKLFNNNKISSNFQHQMKGPKPLTSQIEKKTDSDITIFNQNEEFNHHIKQNDNSTLKKNIIDFQQSSYF